MLALGQSSDEVNDALAPALADGVDFEGQLCRGEGTDFGPFNIDSDHVEAEDGHAHGVGGPQVACPYDCNVPMLDDSRLKAAFVRGRGHSGRALDRLSDAVAVNVAQTMPRVPFRLRRLSNVM